MSSLAAASAANVARVWKDFVKAERVRWPLDHVTGRMAPQRAPMPEDTTRTYRLTAAGVKALKSKRSVPVWYRAVLRLVDDETPSASIIAGMSAYPRRQVQAWIEQLETLGFLELIVRASADSPDAPDEGAFDAVLRRLQAMA